MAKRSRTVKKKEYHFEHGKLREVDKSLNRLLQTAYELKLISKEALHHATTTETNLLIPIEGI